MKYHFINIEFATPEYDEMVALRDLVLRQPLGLQFTVEQLSTEYNDELWGCYDENFALIGCLIITNLGDNCAKMRQFAVHPSYQRKGVGGYLIAQIEKHLKQKGYKLIVLNARDTAIDFYKKNKYESVGEPFVEVGISHLKMEKNIEN
ncbi:MAG: GNAT family N-acetyltransferase [Saprospiraceae bacterium]|nr:GNAT family N-acetyltransferase [Saprospiraceae bacterium]